MSDQHVCVTFHPEGRTVHVLKGTKIIEAGARAGLTTNTPCGGAGTCGKCRVQVTTGAPTPCPSDTEHFSQTELDQGWRLACQTGIESDCTVSIPDRSRLTSQHQIVTESETVEAAETAPSIRKIYVELSPPTLEDNAPDLLRLEEAIGPFTLQGSDLPHVARQFGQCHFKGTAVLAGDRLIDFEPDNTTSRCYGVAFDIGTTTLVGLLLDLNEGREMAVTSGLNPQVTYGDDVLTRIQYASTSPLALGTLHNVLVRAIREMIADLCQQAGVAAEHVYEVTVAGNTTMEHLFSGLDPTALGKIPFAPTLGRGFALEAQGLDLPIHTRASLQVFPVIGGFVGGDTVACILSTGLTQTTDSVLMIDIGTNGEIVLAHEGQLLAASTAAGPAFEGARILCGMRAAPGAIEKVLLEDDVILSVIGYIDPVGICGSGLIDLVAELLDTGMISPTGKLLPPEDLPDTLPEALKKRVRVNTEGRTEFLLWEDVSTESRVILAEQDVRELQLAVAAIRAGITILLKQAGTTPEALDRVLLAGGFGSFIRRNHAQRIGLLPAEIEHNRISHVGNASLAGAKLAMLSTDARTKGEILARQTQHVELSLNMDFQMQYAEAMIFPG